MADPACIALAAFFAVINLAAFIVARRDKRVASTPRRRRPRRRIPERGFHMLALLGGGIGAGAAFLVYRHKTRKWRFLVPWAAAALLGLVLTWAWVGLVCPEA